MKKLSLLFIFILLLTACKSKKVITSKRPSKPKKVTTTRPNTPKETNHSTHSSSSSSSSNTNTSANKIINKAVSYKGTKYKYGGTTKKGMDCSGLMHTAFKAAHINLPRTSFEQSKQGKKVSTKNIQPGDLVFFKTSRKNRINHVGLVVSHNNGNVKFVHASSSRGVMISSLKDGYWRNKYTTAKRILGTSKPTTTTTHSSSKKYTVKKGDTFYAIARKFNNISAQDIMKTNNLSAPDLKPGMILTIPKKG